MRTFLPSSSIQIPHAQGWMKDSRIWDNFRRCQKRQLVGECKFLGRDLRWEKRTNEGKDKPLRWMAMMVDGWTLRKLIELQMEAEKKNSKNAYRIGMVSVLGFYNTRSAHK